MGEDSRTRDLEREVVEVRWESLGLKGIPRRASRGLSIEIDSSSTSDVDDSSVESDCTDWFSMSPSS